MLAEAEAVTTLTMALIKLAGLVVMAVVGPVVLLVKMALQFKLLLVRQTQAVVEVVAVIIKTVL
jgi:hypothetical protein